MKRIDYSKIELLVLDVDGVLTDGRIILGPGGEETKVFHVRDGTGMKYWKRAGRKLAMISGRSPQAAVHRAAELGVDCVKLGAKDKLPAYLEVLAELKVSEDRTAVVGDDLPDLPVMRRCGFPIAVADAVAEVRDAAAYVTKMPGGKGAVREVVELILRRCGAWDGIMAKYIGADAEQAK